MVKTGINKKFRQSFINNLKTNKNLIVQEEKEAGNRELFSYIEGLLDAQDKLVYLHDPSVRKDKDKYN